MQDVPAIPIGMQLLGRFRNDAHTGLDSPAGRNFVIKKERRHWHFSFAVRLAGLNLFLGCLKKKEKGKNQEKGTLIIIIIVVIVIVIFFNFSFFVIHFFLLSSQCPVISFVITC